MTPESYHEMVRRLAHDEVVSLPELGTKIGEIKLSIGFTTKEQAKRLYRERETEKLNEVLKCGHRDNWA